MMMFRESSMSLTPQYMGSSKPAAIKMANVVTGIIFIQTKLQPGLQIN